jgi:hypothetical protein
MTMKLQIGLMSVVMLAMMAAAPQTVSVAAATASAKDSGPRVDLTAGDTGPREVEDTTQKAIVRDYAAAWKTMAMALASNRTDTLDSSFVGIARDQLAARIGDQKKNGLRTRITDRGHKLEAIFYSPEGSALQLRDAAQIQLETLDGDTVLHSEQVTLHYVTLMTVAEDHWKVRLLQEVQ